MKLYNIRESDKNRHKRDVARNRRFYSQADMSIIKHDIAVNNAQKKRKELPSYNNDAIYVCGCGALGCFIRSSRQNK